jgi:hypothetical protein
MFEYELETGSDREAECEFAHEYESEQFFPALIPLVARFAPTIIRGISGLIRSGAARNVGKQIVNNAGNNRDRDRNRKKRQQEFEFESEFESEFEFESERETKLDPYIAKLLSNLGKGQSESESEAELEFEAAPSNEYEVMMENMAYRASQSESEAEAEAFIGALLPVAARLFPKASNQLIAAVTPTLIEGVSQMAQVMHHTPKSRPLLRTMPQILIRTMGTLANQINQGKSLSRTTTLRVLAGNTAKILDNPNRVARIMKKSHKAQHQHRAMTNGKSRPASA